MNCRQLLPAVVVLTLAQVVCSAQDKYAVVVGVETYDTSTFENLRFASEDAEALGRVLRDLDFRATVMSSHAESAKLRPTAPRKIVDALKTVTGSCANGDTLVVILSGHGIQFADEPYCCLPASVKPISARRTRIWPTSNRC